MLPSKRSKSSCSCFWRFGRLLSRRVCSPRPARKCRMVVVGRRLRPGIGHRARLLALRLPGAAARAAHNHGAGGRHDDVTALRLSLFMNQTVIVTGMSNREFLEAYAHPGRVGLSGGITLIDKAIARAERHIDDAGRWSLWSHSFLFQGRRPDGHHWVIESDLQINRKHIRLGVQENRISKYFDEDLYTTLAVLDFGLAETEAATLVREGLELVANRARYSL